MRPDEHFAMSWEVDGKADKRLKEIAKAVKGAEHLYLATDPDREGEAISWHVEEVLRQRKALKGVDVQARRLQRGDEAGGARRLPASARDRPRAGRRLSRAARARLSRRASRCRRCCGASCRAAARPAACNRWRCASSASAKPRSKRSSRANTGRSRSSSRPRAATRFTARLTHLDGKRLDKFDLKTEAEARAAADSDPAAAPASPSTAIERKQIRRNPPPPFTTSTLQQEASRKLGLGASRTMRIAQRLYEGVDIDGETVGLITYMRTDGVTLVERGDRRRAPPHRAADYGTGLSPRRAARLSHPGEERAGGA